MVLHTEMEGLSVLSGLLPFIKTVGWDQAASRAKGVPKSRLLLDSLAATID
jgi:hypothetical protein